MKLAVAWLVVCPVLSAAADGPELSLKDVVNAAARSSGSVAPGEIVVLFPLNAGPAALVGAQLGADGRVMGSAGDTRVLFDGIAAPINYSVSGQIGAVVPYEVARKTTTQVVVEYQGVSSPPVTLRVVDAAPALFTLDSSGKGQAAMLNETGCCNSARNPAARGAVAVLYATGAGQTVPVGIDGSVAAQARIADYPAPAQPVRVTVGGEPAEIVYSGAAPHSVAGLLQVNFRVPANAPLGDSVPLVLKVGSFRSPDGVTMAVRSPTARILVIANRPAIRHWLGTVLKAAGYRVLTARNSDEALTQAGGQPIDLIVSDLTMSSQQRQEAILAIRTDRPQLRVIATARALGSAAVKAADLLGAQAIFTEPLERKAVLQRVHDLLRSRPVPYVSAEDAR